FRLPSSDGPMEPLALASASAWQALHEYVANSVRPCSRVAALSVGVGAGVAGAAAGPPASGRTSCDASTAFPAGAGAGAGAAGWRLATAAGRDVGGAGGGMSLRTKAGGGAGGTQAPAPVAATGPWRGVAYCAAMPPTWAPLRTKPGC